MIKNKVRILLCSTVLLSLLFHRIKIQGSIQMRSVYVEFLNVCWEDGFLSWLICCKATHPHRTSLHAPLALLPALITLSQETFHLSLNFYPLSYFHNIIMVASAV